MMTRRAALAMGAGVGLAPGLALADRVVADVPIRMNGVLPWTGCWIDKQGPFKFLINSGTNAFSIWEPLATKLKLRAAPGRTNVRNHYDYGDANLYRVNEFVVGGAFGLTVVDFAGGGEKDKEPVFLGAMPLLPDRVTSFEWDRGLMRLLPGSPTDTAGYAKVGLTGGAPYLAWQPEVIAKIGGKSVRLRINTGSPYGVVLFPETVARLGAWDEGDGASERTVPRGSNTLKIRNATLGDLELGGFRFEHPLVELHDPHYSATDRQADHEGLIGMQALRRVDLILDQGKRTAWLKPNAHLSEPWPGVRA